MSGFLTEVARQVTQGLWEDVEDAAFAHKLSATQIDEVCTIIARGVPRPGDGSDQPSLTVDDEGWGFPIPKGSSQPQLW